MTEDTKEQSMEKLLKTPPPSEYKTGRGNVFMFGKPALRHRKIVMKVLKIMREPAADYNAIVECAEARGLTVEQFIALKENELTKEELQKIMKHSTLDSNISFAESMNEILTEVLYATIRKAPFQFSSLEEFENLMDDYGEALELFPIAIKWVALASADIGRIDRKNL